MKDRFQIVIDLNGTCVSLCHELLGVLDEERVALVTLKTEEILTTNLKKEALVIRLRRAKNDLRTAMRAYFGVETVEEAEKFYPADRVPDIQKAQVEWLMTWEIVKKKCEQNNQFTQHSLKTMGRFIENLKRLMGENITYSNKGKKVEAPQSGKVVEAKY